MKKIMLLLFVSCFVLSPALGIAYDEMEVKNGGQIMGHVKFTGKPPKLASLKVNRMRTSVVRRNHRRPWLLERMGALDLQLVTLRISRRERQLKEKSRLT